MMRVVMATTADERGGLWRHMLDLSNGLARHDHEIIFAFPPGSDILHRDVAALGYESIAIDQSWKVAADVWHLHLHKTYAKLGFVAVAQRHRHHGRGIVLTEHLPHVAASDPTMEWDPMIRPGVKKPGAKHVKTLLKKAQARACDVLVAPSEASRRFLIERYGLSAQKVIAVSNGVDVETLRTTWPDNDRIRVISIGAPSWRKGHDVLIEAANLVTTEVDIEVLGESPYRAELTAQAQRAGNKVHFSGYSPDAAHRYIDADIACVPSRTESSSYAALEAMARSCPVIASDIEGPGEIVVDGQTGLLVPPGDAPALARAIDQLASDAQRRVSMGEAGYRRAMQQFSLDAMVQDTARVYRSIVEARS